MPNTLQLTLNSAADTDQLGHLLAKHLPDGSTISLVGTLGAGKTRLVQAIGNACGLPPGSITSPTFVLCQFYHANRSICHIDAYRIADLEEFLDLGVEDVFDSNYLTFIEWGDRVKEALPDQLITLELEVLAAEKRLACLTVSDSYLELLGLLSTDWPGASP